jgi:hypothetical protein
MDVGVLLCEVMPDGQLFHRSCFLGRASYAKDMRVRQLLTPGKLESIPFDKTRTVQTLPWQLYRLAAKLVWHGRQWILKVRTESEKLALLLALRKKCFELS